MADEARLKGLIIIEAYYGLDEHIYQLEAGVLEYTKVPETVKEYYEAQVVPIKKLLTIMISNS